MREPRGLGVDDMTNDHRLAPRLKATTAAMPGWHVVPVKARDQAIDAMRGLCIVSMTTAHLAAGSLPWQVTHSAVFIDGAVGFVLLSGVVVGMTQRRKIDHAGLATGESTLLRRTALIYAAHLALCLLALVIVTADPARLDSNRSGGYVGIPSLGGPLPAAIATVTLRVNPHYTSILSLYVVLLLLAMAAVAALAHRLTPLVVAASLGLYAAGYWWPLVFTLESRPGISGAVNWATWQLLFVGALLIGWNWRSSLIRWAVHSRLAWCSAVLLVGTVAGLGWLTRLAAGHPWNPVVTQVFTEGTLSPATILTAFCAALVGYPICRTLVRSARPLVAPIARLGRHSLDCYLILSASVIMLPSVSRYDPTGLIPVGVTFDILLVMIGWCLLRDLAIPHQWREQVRRSTAKQSLSRISSVVLHRSDSQQRTSPMD